MSCKLLFVLLVCWLGSAQKWIHDSSSFNHCDRDDINKAHALISPANERSISSTFLLRNKHKITFLGQLLRDGKMDSFPFSLLVTMNKLVSEGDSQIELKPLSLH